MKFIIKKIKHIKKFILFFNMSYFNFLNKQRVFLRKNFNCALSEKDMNFVE